MDEAVDCLGKNLAGCPLSVLSIYYIVALVITVVGIRSIFACVIDTAILIFCSVICERE